tara:strand:- start:1003 stop:2160 length:1158 start_codon:yes stop_codon:yes gene_type:complete
MKKKFQVFRPSINKIEINSLIKVMKSGWLTSGNVTLKFENEVRKTLKVKNAIAVNSCTNGIFAALHALGLKKNDEVITTPLTFVSTIHNLFNFGLKIKLVDINLDDFSLSAKILEKNISSKTKCVLITHYGGIPANIKEIIKICKRKNIKVIEDAATAFGAKLNNKNIGSFNNSIAVFSFYANKIITTGEGGVITLNNNRIAKKIRNLISCGIDKDPWQRSLAKKSWFYKVPIYGFKYNFTDLQASIGLEQIKKLKKIQHYRRQLRKLYDKELKPLYDNQILIKNYKNKKSVYSEYIYTLLINENYTNLKRDNLIMFLKKKNINCTVHYIPANKHLFYKYKFNNFKLTNSDYVFNNILSIPFHNNISMKDAVYIAREIKKFFKIN